MNTSPLARQLQRIWRALPQGPVSERELEDRILEITNHGAGDYAWAGAVRGQLVSSWAVIVLPGEQPRELVYEKAAKFPEWPRDNGPGSESFNAELRRIAEAQEAEMREHDRLQADALETSPMGVQRRQLLELIDERATAIVGERIGELLGSLDDQAVARMRARFTDQAGAGQPEGAHDEHASQPVREGAGLDRARRAGDRER